MSRLALSATALLWASTIACSSMGGNAPQTAVLAVCKEFLPGQTADLKVEADGSVFPVCALITSGKSKVVWTGPTGTRSMGVSFINVPNAPPNIPVQPGNTLTLPASQLEKTGFFDYAMAIVLADGTNVIIDPRLIIQPAPPPPPVPN